MNKKLFSNIATLVQSNAEEEANAIVGYNELLQTIRMIETENKQDEETKQDLISMVEELIANELNHQKTLHEAYIALTGIKANKS